jgi:hypothetical protein
MVDINTSQEYDSASFEELLAEQRRKKYNPLAVAFGTGGGAQSATTNALLGFGPPYPGDQTLLGRPMALGYAAAQTLLGSATPPGYFEAVTQVKRELADPIAFMETWYPGQRLWRFVLTHPDLDHMRGIKRLYQSIGFDNFWDTTHTKPTPDYRNNDDKVDWEFYQQLRSGILGFRPRFYTRGDALFAFAQNLPGCDNIEILSPTADLINKCNRAAKSNDVSMVLRLWHAGRSVLPGDAEGDAWDAMVGFYGNRLKSEFFKASHHGRDSGYHIGAMHLIAPVLTFVSVG